MGAHVHFPKGADAPTRGLPIAALLAAFEAMELAGMSANPLADGALAVVDEGARLAPGTVGATCLPTPAGLAVFMPPGSIAHVERDGARPLHLMLSLSGNLSCSALPFAPDALERDAQTIPAAAAEWLASGEAGASSKALCSFFFGYPPAAPPEHPRDPSDLRRCVMFLEATGTSGRIGEAASLSPQWAALAARWDALAALLGSEMAQGGSAPLTWEAMRRALDPNPPPKARP